SKGASAENDPNFFASGPAWSEPYSVIKQANLLIQSVNKSEQITEEQKKGYLGVAKTIKALQFMQPLLTHKHSKGIRLDISAPLDPGPFVPFTKAIVQILDQLDNGKKDLEQAGTSFNFVMPDGMSLFNTPTKFIS